MDFADDVAYSVHDLEDGVVGGRIDLAVLDRPEERAATWRTVQEWYLPDATDAALEEAFAPGPCGRLLARCVVRREQACPGLAEEPHQRPDRHLLRQRPPATRAAHGDEPLVRHRGDVVVPLETQQEIAVLKGIAAHYVMRAQDRLDLMERQRTLLHELFEAIWKRGSDGLDPAFREDFAEAADDAARTAW